MVVLGLDIGYDRCGFAILSGTSRKNELVTAGVILTDKKLPIQKRLRILKEDLISIDKQYKPEVMCIEKLFFNRRNTVFEKICMSKGIAFEIFCDTTIIEVEPKKAKKDVLGDGNIDKKQVKFLVAKLFNTNFDNVPDDTYDAIYLALYGLQTRELEKMYNRS